ncbi:MAG: hypothetical protein NTX17_05795 [Candidatus Eisenbacteria bacterium]|nr:hypothetical protein [Candidatus Eisenbacteria bacterium]
MPSKKSTRSATEDASLGKQAYVLYLRIEQYRVDLHGAKLEPVPAFPLFEPERLAAEQAFGTALMAALNEFNALLKETRQLLEKDPDLSPELVRLVPAGASEEEMKEALSVSSKEQLLIWSGRLLAIVKAYVMFHAPMEEKRKIGFV